MADTATATDVTKTAEATKTTEAPKTGEQKLPPGYRPGFDMPPQPNVGFENDPNFKLQEMVRRRGKKKEEEGAKAGNETETKTEKTTETTEKKAETSSTKPGTNLADLIAKNLKFREPTGGKKEEKGTEGVKTETKATETETKETKTEAKDTKTVVTKKKPEPTVADHMRNAGEIAAAAASAAVTAAMPRSTTPQSKAAAPEDDLPEDFRYEFEVAKQLSATNPKYKDAPQKILNEYNRRSEYARNWEAQNPGKVFDPDDDDHNAFEESLERPWSDHEFRRAEIQLEAKALASEQSAEDRKKLKELEEKTAKTELAPIAGQTVQTVALLLAQNVDQAVHDLIVKEQNGFAKLQENDPITADALVDALNALNPRIQTAIFVDDPEQRISFDPKKNRDQGEWLSYLRQKEAHYAGTMDERGRLFASRTEYVQLPEAQRARRWFLTQDHIISEMVADAVADVKTRVEKERERGKKVAAALGYVPQPDTKGAKAGETHKSDATNEKKETKVETSTATDTKPVSPTVGSGAKIDTHGEKNTTKFDDLWSKTGKILFGR